MDRHSIDKDFFEDSWRKALDEAEITPSDRVWSIVSKSMDVLKYRYRSQLYGMIAAVAVLIAIGLSIQSEWIGNETHFGDIYLSKKSDKYGSKGRMKIEDESSMGPPVEYTEFGFFDLSKFQSNSVFARQKKSGLPILDRKIITPDKKDYQLLDNTLCFMGE